jgi:hypothetical protein
VQDWDLLCISELQAAQQAAGHAAVALSTYPLGYHGQGAAAAVPSTAPATLLCAKEFDESGLLRVQARWGGGAELPGSAILHVGLLEYYIVLEY